MAVTVPPTLMKWSRDHAGVVSSTDLALLGVTERVRRGLINAQLLVPLTKSTYLVGSCPATEEALVLGATLARDDIAVSGPTAGRHWGFRRLDPFENVIHVVSAPHSQPFIAKWIKAYRCAVTVLTDSSEGGDVNRSSSGVPFTSPATTAIHLTRFVPRDLDLISIFEQAIHQHCSEQDLFEVLGRFRSPRRPWSLRAERLLSSRFGLKAAESHGEVELFLALVDAGLKDLCRQHRLILPTLGQIRLDIAEPRLRWGVEVDLHPSHFSQVGAARDKERDRECRVIGWQVERVTEADFARGLPRLVAQLLDLREIRHRELAVR
jgi:hypothetical protein